MEKIKNYLSFVEIKTKLATTVPFLTGVAYALYVSGGAGNRRIDLAATLLLAVTMFPFDMAVTAINNHIGKRASGVAPHYSDKASLAIIICLISVSTALGLYMTSRYGIMVLIVGLLCYVVGIFYTFGPIPIAHSAYGEIFSGFTQGLLITFLSAYVNLPRDWFINISISLGGYDGISGLFSLLPVVKMSIISPALAKLFVAAVPLICCIANIMLANNTCDVDEDVAVRRYTLPYYIGIPKALKLFAALYYIAGAAIVFGVITRVLPLTCLLVAPVYIVLRKNIARFREKQVKHETFPLAVNNFIMLCGANIILIFIGCLF